MTFHQAESELRERVIQLVRRGEISERRLARQTGYTQPHIHNVLKGARRLHSDVADRLLAAAGLRLEDLSEREPATEAVVEIAVWRGAVGPRHRFPEPGQAWETRPLAARFAARFDRPVLLRAAAEQDAMAPLVLPADLVLLDQTEGPRRRPALEGIWALSFAGRGALCRCQVVGSALILVVDHPGHQGRLPDHVPLGKRDILEVVRGRVVWVGRELDLV